MKSSQDQRGYILALSLVIMLFGTLVVGSLLSYVNANVNTRAIARDNLDAYYAADAGIQLVIAKLIQADYKDGGELGPLPERVDDGDGVIEDGECYALSDSDLFPDASLSDEINGYMVRMTVEHVDMWMPDYVDYEITAYAFEAGASNFNEAKDTVVAVVRQVPYPLIEAMTYQASIISWQRQ